MSTRHDHIVESIPTEWTDVTALPCACCAHDDTAVAAAPVTFDPATSPLPVDIPATSGEFASWAHQVVLHLDSDGDTLDAHLGVLIDQLQMMRLGLVSPHPEFLPDEV